MVLVMLEETPSTSLTLEFVGLVVEGKARQVAILDTKSCILQLSKKVLSISLSNSSTWTDSRISLFNHFACSFCSAISYFFMISVSILSLASLLKWLFYAALLIFFIDRTQFPEGALSLPLRDIPLKRQLKLQTKKQNKLLFY